MYDYIIVGTGIGGLNLGYKLSKKYPKKKILLIEKDYNIGGRIQSVYLHNNLYYESGGIRFYPEHKNLLSLLKDFKYLKKDFIKIPHDYKRDLVINKNVKKNENELNQILIDNKDNFTEKQLLNMTFETYSKKFLTKDELHYLKTFNGFPHIFTETSACNGLMILKRDFHDIKHFYIIKSSLSNFLYKIVDYIQEKNNNINLGEEFINFTKKNNIISVKTNKNIYNTHNLILTIPLENLNKINNKLLDKKIINTVNQIPLCRIFAIFPQNNYWYEKINSTYTDNKIQRIFTKGNRLIQISYSSNNNAKFWKNKNKNLEETLLKELKTTFPKKKILKPDYLKSHFWNNGIHLWNTKINGNEISNKIIKPNNDLNLFICNECYSYNQRWMEGSVEMSNRVFNLILNRT